MSAKRKSVVRKADKHARRLASIRSGYAKSAALMGVSALFEKLPARVKNWLWTMPVLEPSVLPDAASEDRSNATAVRATLQRRIEQATVKLDDGTEFAVTDLLTFSLGMNLCCAEIIAKIEDADLKRAASESQLLVRAFLNRYQEDATWNMIVALRLGAAEYSRIDKELVSFTFDWHLTPTGRRRVAITFTLTEPQEIKASIHGQYRRAFRCGGQHRLQPPLEWVTWPASTIGVEGENRDYPVYVQHHAIHRIEERLGVVGIDGAHFWLRESLKNPNVVAVEGDFCTIEYRFLDHRLGYLMARRLADCVVVTTFVFLTMQGSPEARLLYEKLRLQRSDIEYQKLDRLSTFTDTDLLDDPELLEIFSQCGWPMLPTMEASCNIV